MAAEFEIAKHFLAELLDLLLQPANVLAGHQRHFRIRRFGLQQGAIFLQVGVGLHKGVAGRHQILEAGVLPGQFLGALVVVEDFGVAERGLDFGKPAGKPVNVRAQIHIIINGECAKKTVRPHGMNHAGGLRKTKLFLFLLGCGRGLGGLRLGHALLELVHAAGGVHEFLLARVERMAGVADADDDGVLGGTGLDHVATGATDFRVHIFGMYGFFHKRPAKIASIHALTSGKFPESTSPLLIKRKTCKAR